MSQSTDSQHSNLSWYSLARLVSQGEKEKAIGLFRLISYSFDDKAFILQVEGDLLKAFKDDRSAVEKYLGAACLYRKESKLVAAASIYEHILEIDPNNYEYIGDLVELYSLLEWQDRMFEKTTILLDCFNKKMVSKEYINKIVQLVVEQFLRTNNTSDLNRFKDLVEEKSPSVLANMSAQFVF